MGRWRNPRRQLPFHFAGQQIGAWRERGEYPAGELTGATLLCVGLGGAGLGTCERAKAFGMRVIATRRRPTAEAERPACVDELHAVPALAAAPRPHVTT